MRALKFISIMLIAGVLSYVALMFIFATVPYKSRPVALITNSYYTWKGGGTYRKFREFDRNAHYDVVVLGSSRAYRGYDPQVFADSGFSMFNLGTSAQSIRNTYFIAENYITAENTGLLIVDLFSGSFRPTQLESSSDLIQNLDSRVAAQDIAWNSGDIRCFNMLMLRMLTEAAPSSFTESDYKKNGYASKSDSLSKKLRNYLKVFRQPDSVTLSTGSDEMKYFNKLVALCRERRIPLVLVYSPTSAFYSRKNHVAFMQQIEPIALKCRLYDYSDFQLSTTDCFYDDTHLNSAGVIRFNKSLIASLHRDSLLRAPDH